MKQKRDRECETQEQQKDRLALLKSLLIAQSLYFQRASLPFFQRLYVFKNSTFLYFLPPIPPVIAPELANQELSFLGVGHL